MGNLLSVNALKQHADASAVPLSGKSAASTTAATTSSASPPAPLFLSDVKAEPAVWSQEGLCLTFQRLFGMLPDSEAEVLKQSQRQPQFRRRPSSFGLNVHMRADAIVVVQRVFRRYRLVTKWHNIAAQVLELARSRIDTRRAADEEAMTLAQFRALLGAGFSAHKVSITGALKNIQLQLVMDAKAEECYLTWSPSRKRQPRIHLHDVEQVVPVLRTGNKHAPRLANKVSHRRGLIIVCKSHHRGRVVLEMASKYERNLLLCGFERLIGDMNALNPTLDDAGALRKRLPRRQSVIEFFDPNAQSPTSMSTPLDSAGAVDEPQPHLSPSSTESISTHHASKPQASSSTDGGGSESGSAVREPPAKRNSATIKQLYVTRFDADPKATHVRRSSMVATIVQQQQQQ